MSGNPDWRDTQQTLGGQLWYMYQNQIRTDLSIAVFNGQRRQVFNCHKIIVTRLSSVFETLMYEVTGSEENYINISAVDPCLFSKILQFAYTDKLEIDSADDALKLFGMCKSYDIRHLAKLCMKYLVNNLDGDSVWRILDNFSLMSAKEKANLSIKVEKYIETNTETCLQSESFLTCSQSSLLYVLTKERLNLTSELQLVFAVIRWCQRQSSGVVLDSTRAKQLLGPCLQHLRFLSLTTVEFSANVASSGLLSQEECLSVLINISSPGQIPLAKTICGIKECRTSSTPAADANLAEAVARQAQIVSQFVKANPAQMSKPSVKNMALKVKQAGAPNLTKVHIKSTTHLAAQPLLSIKQSSSERKLMGQKAHVTANVQFTINTKWCFNAVSINFGQSRGNKSSLLSDSNQLRVKLAQFKGPTLQISTVSLTNSAKVLTMALNFNNPTFLEENTQYFLQIKFISPAEKLGQANIASVEVRGGNLSVLLR